MGLLDDAWAVAQGKFSEVAAAQGEALWASFKGLVKEDAPAAKQIVRLFQEAIEFKLTAMATANPAERAELEGAVTTSLRRARVLALAEGVVASDAFAAWLEASASATIKALGEVAHAVLSTVIESAVRGAVEGATGGSGAGIGTIVLGLAGLVGGGKGADPKGAA